MVIFQINGEQRSGDDITEQWIIEQFNAATQNGGLPCFRATVQISDCDAILATAACGGGGGGRILTDRESQLVTLWQRAHLNDASYSAGNVISFLKRLKTFC